MSDKQPIHEGQILTGTLFNEHALSPFLEENRSGRVAGVEHIAAHIELSLTELLQRADEEICNAALDKEQKVHGAEGWLAQAGARDAEILNRREKRRQELKRQKSLSLQAVERIMSVLILPYLEREAPEIRCLSPGFEVEAVAMNVVLEYEKSQNRQVFDVHEKNLGYDITSLDLNSGELRLIEVKGIGSSTGQILLTPNSAGLPKTAGTVAGSTWLLIVTPSHNYRNPSKTPH